MNDMRGDDVEEWISCCDSATSGERSCESNGESFEDLLMKGDFKYVLLCLCDLWRGRF